ncbi:hypothetical protein CSAL01_05252 [Colletotrichum salicis]|uniref:Uncharacterized protein n=1 Tax=Colletotrichum salicis TaxID=1209931 RepID=A0A135UM05_9PEZI|nr:hypothetical protein CSAL01_05252 [Colletotrichum salicis]
MLVLPKRTQQPESEAEPATNTTKAPGAMDETHIAAYTFLAKRQKKGRQDEIERVRKLSEGDLQDYYLKDDQAR